MLPDRPSEGWEMMVHMTDSFPSRRAHSVLLLIGVFYIFVLLPIKPEEMQSNYVLDVIQYAADRTIIFAICN